MGPTTEPCGVSGPSEAAASAVKGLGKSHVVVLGINEIWVLGDRNNQHIVPKKFAGSGLKSNILKHSLR